MMSNCQKLSVSFSSLIVELSENNEKLKAENQKLRDKIILMKGEQPKPDIKPSGKKPNVDISSEEERKPKNGTVEFSSDRMKHFFQNLFNR